METVNFLATLWGFTFILVSFTFLVSAKNIRRLFAMVEDEKILLLIGMINIVFGVGLVLAYNTWDLSWKVIVAILGWLVIARGSLILFFPSFVKKIVAYLKSHTEWVSTILVIAVLLGCFLVYAGFTF